MMKVQQKKGTRKNFVSFSKCLVRGGPVLYPNEFVGNKASQRLVLVTRPKLLRSKEISYKQAYSLRGIPYLLQIVN